MTDSFYRAYEDRHRGSRELIKSRLRAYAPFIDPLALLYQPAAALDLGCGRGEWLELLGESGFDAFGVDIDDGMLAACRERGLNARQEDALKALQQLPDDSMALVSAFHVVEHLPFEFLRAVVREALRVLKPGGLLVFETPNPENLVVGSSSFYQDPTHERPIPPELLSFVVEHAGFFRNRVVRLQEEKALHGATDVRLIHVLNGVSPDYGVVAQKQTPEALLARFDAAFEAPFGISLDTLAARYDDSAAKRFAHMERLLVEAEGRVASTIEHMSARVSVAEERIAQITARAAQAEAQTMQVQARAIQAESIATRAEAAATQAEAKAVQAESKATQSEIKAIQAEAHANQLTQQVQAMLLSRSWRITAPMRLAGSLFYRFRSAYTEGRLASGIKRRLKTLIVTTRLGRDALSALNRTPRLKSWLRRKLDTPPAGMPAAPTAPPPSQSTVDLSPRADRIYAELQRTLRSRKN